MASDEMRLSKIEVTLARIETKLDRSLCDISENERDISKVYDRVGKTNQKMWWIAGVGTGIVIAWEAIKEILRK